MEPLILLAVLVLVAGPAALILALLALARARRIERELIVLRKELSAFPPSGIAVDVSPASPPDAARLPPPPLPQTVGAEPSVRPVAVKRPARDLESRIGGEWLTWIGILAIFFGTAFFLAVNLGDSAFAGQGQVWVGLAVAVGFLGVGSVFSGRSTLFLGQGLLGGGTALVFLSVFAASAFHELIGLTTAYLLLISASLLGSALAVVKNSRTVAGLTLTGALITPLLLETTNAHPLLFPYLVFVSLGAAVVRLRKSWPGLVLGAFLGTTLLVLSWWDRFFSPETRMEALYGVGTLWILYVVLPFVARSTVPLWRLAGSALVLANAGAIALFLWSWLGSVDFLRGIAIAGLGLAYVLLGRLRIRPELQMVYELAGLGLGAVALPIHFDLETVTVGWSLLAVILVHLGVERSSGPHRVLGYFVLAFALGHHLLFDLETLGFGSSRPTDGVRTQWVAGITGAAAILAVAWLLRRARARRTNLTDLEARSGTGLILTATAFLLYLLSVQVWRSLEDEGERRALLGLSFAWAVYGGGLIAIGFLRHFRPLRLAGVGLLLGLVLKLFTLDMSVLERGERIASFIGVGVLLLVVSLLYQNRRRKEEPNDD